MAHSNDLAAPLTYEIAGVDIGAGEALVARIAPMAKATARRGTGAALGGFGALFDPKAAGFADPILVASNDGVGTKVKIAIETGLHDTIGIDLVAMCANDVAVQGAQPLFFLDYFACAKLDVEVAVRVVGGVAEGCRLAGAALTGGETAEMPGLYAPGDYDLAGFCVGAAERGTLLPREDICTGDIIVGVASSGLHSNGFSLVRKIIEAEGLRLDEPAPFDPRRSLGVALLDPTTIYVKAALAAHATGCVKSFAHITGGGLPGNLPRVLPNATAAAVDLGAIQAHPVFGWIARAGRVPEAEMLRTFNCGVGFAAVAAPENAGRVIDIFAQSGFSAFILGNIEERAADGPSFRSHGHLRLGQ